MRLEGGQDTPDYRCGTEVRKILQECSVTCSVRVCKTHGNIIEMTPKKKDGSHLEKKRYGTGNTSIHTVIQIVTSTEIF